MKKENNVNKSKNWIIGTTIIGAAVGLLYALFYEQYFFEIKQFDIGNRKNRKRIKVLLLSDIHLNKSLWFFHFKLAKTINKINPQILLITGDAVDTKGDIELLDEFLSLIKHSIPKIAILGNHDYSNSASNDHFRTIYEKYNGRLLINESTVFQFGKKRLAITGLDDLLQGNPSVEEAVKSLGREANHVLLIHSPKHQETVLKEIERINSTRSDDNKLAIDYIFAGHNHGGQVTLFNYVPVLPECSGNYINGWYNDKPPYLYLSKGYGTTRLPIRFNARSEITVFNYYLS